jgi:hypothetical protein
MRDMDLHTKNRDSKADKCDGGGRNCLMMRRGKGCLQALSPEKISGKTGQKNKFAGTTADPLGFCLGTVGALAGAARSVVHTFCHQQGFL